MHELALAEAVIATALDAARRDGISDIGTIAVRIGELQRIDPEAFRFNLDQVVPATEPRIAGTRISVEVEPARFRCRCCRQAFGLADIPGPGGHAQAEAIHFVPELAHCFLACPGCDSPDFEVLAGRGVSIESIEAR